MPRVLPVISATFPLRRKRSRIVGLPGMSSCPVCVVDRQAGWETRAFACPSGRAQSPLCRIRQTIAMAGPAWAQ